MRKSGPCHFRSTGFDRPQPAPLLSSPLPARSAGQDWVALGGAHNRKSLCRRRVAVPIDTDKIDETVLALLRLTLHDRARAWKGHDWEALNRLHRKGMIGDPVGVALGVAERLRLRPMWSSDRK